MFRHRKPLVAALGAGALVVVGATAAYASLPAGTTVTGNLKSGTDMTFKGDIDSVPITVSCTTFTATGVVPKSPSYTVTLSKPPTLSGCTDSAGGTDNIKTKGKWKLTESKTAPYQMTLLIPKKGASFTSSVLSGCTVTAAPSGSVKVTGSYDGTNTDTVTNAPIKTKGTGCTSTTASTSATVVLSPSPGAPPF